VRRVLGACVHCANFVSTDELRFPWRPLLERWSRAWLQDTDYAMQLPEAVVESGWLGYPPATDDEIAAAEQRLGTVLPASYRAFLRVTNGWRPTSPFIERLWGTDDLEWLSVRNQHLISVWTSDEMPDCWERRALPGALEVSDWGDAALYVLHPGAVRDDGEWEAAFFASWYPGARVYGSFWELMAAEYESFVQLRGDKQR
jgi:hypothetical protein